MTPDRLRELEDIQNANCPCVECAGIRELVAEVRRLQGVIAQHDLCHDLHGKVNAADFAAGCAAEQRRLYGCAPDADETAQLRTLLSQLADAAGPFALQAEIMDNGNDNPPPDRDAMKGYLGSPWPTIGDCRRLAAARDAARAALEGSK